MRNIQSNIVHLLPKDQRIILHRTYVQYYPSLCFFANKILEDKPAAEDLVTETFVKLWKKDPDLKSYENIRAVLYTSVRNACFNFIEKERNEKLRRSRYAYLFEQDDTEDFVLNEITRAEVLREVYEEMQKLPPQCRQVMELYFKEGLDHKKIAEKLDVTVSTVKNQKARGIKILKNKLGPLFILFCMLLMK